MKDGCGAGGDVVIGAAEQNGGKAAAEKGDHTDAGQSFCGDLQCAVLEIGQKGKAGQCQKIPQKHKRQGVHAVSINGL